MVVRIERKIEPRVDLGVIAHYRALPVIVRTILIALEVDDVLGLTIVLAQHHDPRRASMRERERDGGLHTDDFGLAFVGLDETDAVPIIFSAAGARARARARAFQVGRELLPVLIASVQV